MFLLSMQVHEIANHFVEHFKAHLLSQLTFESASEPCHFRNPRRYQIVSLSQNHISISGMDDGTMESLSGSQDVYDDLDADLMAIEKEGGQGMGKGKQFALNSAKKRFGGGVRSKTNYQKMKVPEIGKKRGMKTKMRGVFGVPGLGLQVRILIFILGMRNRK